MMSDSLTANALDDYREAIRKAAAGGMAEVAGELARLAMFLQKTQAQVTMDIGAATARLEYERAAAERAEAELPARLSAATAAVGAAQAEHDATAREAVLEYHRKLDEAREKLDAVRARERALREDAAELGRLRQEAERLERRAAVE